MYITQCNAKTVGTEGKLDTINRNKKGWMKCYIYSMLNVTFSVKQWSEIPSTERH